jgi:hypothetical protein
MLTELVDRSPAGGRGVPSFLSPSRRRRRCNAGEEGMPMLRVVTAEPAGEEMAAALADILP